MIPVRISVTSKPRKILFLRFLRINTYSSLEFSCLFLSFLLLLCSCQSTEAEQQFRRGGVKCELPKKWLRRSVALVPCGLRRIGGVKWTRTTDLTLIRRVL